MAKARPKLTKLSHSKVRERSSVMSKEHTWLMIVGVNKEKAYKGPSLMSAIQKGSNWA